MLLCLDIGNTQIFGGIFSENNWQLNFCCPTSFCLTSDEIGKFLKNILFNNALIPSDLKTIAISSVVPKVDHQIDIACKKYFNIQPIFLTAINQKILTIKIDDPTELGADLIAGGISAVKKYPNRNIIIVDLGTATTFAVIDKNCTYLGTVILPGISSSMNALKNKTAKLSMVEILKPEKVLGKNTNHCIQSGLYYGHLGIMKEVLYNLKKEIGLENFLTVGTGGFVYLFEAENLFDIILPNLLLDGLKYFIG